jgi:hypothetical protein
VLVDEDVPRVQIAVTEHGVRRWWHSGLTCGEHFLDGRVVDAVEVWVRGAEIRQDVASPDRAADRVGASERVDRQAGVGGQRMQLGDEPAQRSSDLDTDLVGDLQLGARQVAGAPEPPGRVAIDPDVLRHRDRQAQLWRESRQQGDLAVDARQRDLPAGKPEYPVVVDQDDRVVPSRGDDPHVVGGEPAGPHHLASLGDGHFSFRLPR